MKILLIPILVVLLSVVICERSYKSANGNYVYTNAYYGYECWGTSHIVLSIISLSYTLLIVVLGTITSLIFNDSRSNSFLPWGS